MAGAIVHVVDDDKDVRKGTARFLEAAGLEVRTYATAGQFLAVVDPDWRGCVILDVQLPDDNGLALQAALAGRAVSLPIIFVTAHGAIPDSVRAIQSGAVDFLTKPVDGKVLLAAVERAFAQDASTCAARGHKKSLRERYERLTPREKDVFAHLISGQLNKQVAGDLQITERTVKMYRASILGKLEVTSMAELARLAVDLGIVPAGRPRA